MVTPVTPAARAVGASIPTTRQPLDPRADGRPKVDVRRALRALAVLHRDPNRLDQVLALGEAVNAPVFLKMWASFLDHPEGAEVVRDQPFIDEDHVDFDALRALPDGTLGREYARFLDTNGISPKAFAIPPETSDVRAMFLALRMRQSHDLWHVLTDYRTDVDGELLLQGFTLAQTGAPIALVLTVFGAIRWGWQRPGFFRDLRQAYAAGKRAAYLPPLYWERRWHEPVVNLRRQLGLAEAGTAPAGRRAGIVLGPVARAA